MAKIKRIKLPNDSSARDVYDTGAVRFDEVQSLTNEQKLQARQNIDTCDYTTICDITTTEEIASIVHDIDLTQYDQLLVDVTVVGSSTNSSAGNIRFMLRDDDSSSNSIQDSQTKFVPTSSSRKGIYSAIFLISENKVQGFNLASSNTYPQGLYKTNPLSFYTKAEFYTGSSNVLGIGTKFKLIGVKFNAHT